MQQRRWWAIGSLVLLAIICLYQLNVVRAAWYRSSVNPYISVYINVPAGTSLINLAKQLQAQGLINNARYFIWLARLRYAHNSIKAGEYAIPPSSSPANILKQLHQGKVFQYTITLVDGWTIYQVQAALNEQPRLKHQVGNTPPKQLMQQLGFAPSWPEGLFFPDTYFYIAGTSDKAILQRAHKSMQQKLNQAWQHRAAGLPYDSPYQALIAASLIEKESADPSERTLISSVLVNRLRLGMPLQIDPTVIYGMGEQYDGSITSKDLRQDTLYNTYIRMGLPPTPIAIPSESAIEAALHPATTKYLYFVAKGNGLHQFSETLTQHDKAVKNYLLMLKQNM